MARLDRKDFALWAAAFGAALMVVAAVYLVAFRIAPQGKAFSGMFYDAHDGYTYWAWSEVFRRGGLLVDNPYSTLPANPQYFNLVWFVLGKAMKYTGLPYLPLYYLFGIVAGGAMYLAILALMRQITGDRASAWFAFLLAGFGSGFGWVIALVSPGSLTHDCLPSDLYCGDGFPFFSFLSFPHLSLSFFMLTMIYFCMYRATVLSRRRWSLGAALLVLMLGFSHPYHLVSLLPIIGIWYLALTARHGKKWLGHWIDFLILAVGALPPLAYFRYLFKGNPNFSSWAQQNIVTSGGPSGVLVGLGLFLLLAIPGIWRVCSRRMFDDRHLLILTWTAVNFALLFSYPWIKFEGRLIQGIVLPLAVLSAWGFFGAILPRLRPDSGKACLAGQSGGEVPSGSGADRRFLWVLPVVLLTSPTYVALFANQLAGAVKGEFPLPITSNTMMFMPGKVRHALDFAARNLAGSRVMSSEEIGLVLPVFADVRSFIGHYGITPIQPLKEKVERRFYDSNSSDKERLATLLQWQIDCVWRGPEEWFVGQYDPSQSSFLRKVFDNGEVAIYETDRAAARQFPSGP